MQSASTLITQPKRKVLLVDDEDIFRKALQSSLEQEGFVVTGVNNGKTALDIGSVEEFDLVVSDINMPHLSGLALTKALLASKPNLPIILMTGFSTIEETKEAYALGARGFIAKPFTKTDLLEIVKKTLYPEVEEKKASAIDNHDSEYCKLNIDEFVTGHQMKYGIYIRLSPQKYVKIANQGEDLSIDRIKVYKEKGIFHLYMRKDEFKKYMQFNVGLSSVVKASSFSPEKKLGFMKHTSEIILEQIYYNDIEPNVVDGAKTILESTVSILLEEEDTSQLIDILSSHTDFLYAHSVAVSMYGVMLAQKIGWTQPSTIHKIALGGLLHDIGKKEIDRSILEKARKDLTSEEVKIYETHPQRGMEILSQLPSISSDVLQIVGQHHENCVGLGFPSGLKKERIHPMARMIAVVNEFCSLILKSPKSPGIGTKEAIRKMEIVHAQKLDSQFFEALKQLIKA